MTLDEILEEICIGYHQNDSKSNKLQKYVKEVIEVLSEDNAVYEGRKIVFKELSSRIDTNLDGDTFLQGSYGTNTAIKHKFYDVDADIAFIIDNNNIDLRIRELIYNKLLKAFGSKYIVEKKKPCITIDFKDKYKIDVAIYTRVNDVIYFHNCIGGVERAYLAKPKELISYFNNYYKQNNTRRKVVRLIKHFIKTANNALEIEECNKIPSISINLLLCDRNMHIDANEDELYEDVLNSIRYIKEFIEVNGYEGPRLESLYVHNTFYKVKNIYEMRKVIDKVLINLEYKQYDQIIEKDVYERISIKNNNKVDGSFTGTMG